MISIYSNTLGLEELSAVDRIFTSRWLGRGKECTAFEKELAEYWKTDSVMLFNCCTSAIYTALRALGIKAGDEVIVSTINFVACASAVLELGAIPIYADADKWTLNILPSEIDRLKSNRTKAVLMMHYAGNPADMDSLLLACNGIPIIEDSACAISSKYKGRYCGTIGAAGCWSFDAMKILVTGDGGALYINSEYRERAAVLRYLGIAEQGQTGRDKAGADHRRWWEYELKEPAGRFIMNDISAAIGRVQLKKLEQFISLRKTIWRTYQVNLHGVGDLILPPEPMFDCTSSYYTYWIATSMRDELAGYLKRHGIYTTFRYYPLHLATNKNLSLKNAEYAADNVLNIPLHQNLSETEVSLIINSIKDFYAERMFNV